MLRYVVVEGTVGHRAFLHHHSAEDDHDHLGQQAHQLRRNCCVNSPVNTRGNRWIGAIPECHARVSLAGRTVDTPSSNRS